MRRAIFLAIPLLVLVALVTGMVVMEAGRPADWRVALDEYVGDQAMISPGGITAQSAARASKPWNFSQEMSRGVLGSRMWGRLDLPFPPEEVWCVLLKRGQVSTDEPGGETPYQVVFVGYHTDRLWRTGWVVHEGARSPFSPAFMASLLVIGCDLGLEE
jgi:hypothetical protein